MDAHVLVTEAIDDYTAHGWSIIPIRSGDKRPLVRWEEFQYRRPCVEEVQAWFSGWLEAGIGIVTHIMRKRRVAGAGPRTWKVRDVGGLFAACSGSAEVAFPAARCHDLPTGARKVPQLAGPGERITHRPLVQIWPPQPDKSGVTAHAVAPLVF